MRREEEEGELPEAAAPFLSDAPLGRTPDPMDQYSPRFHSREQAIEAILDWSPKVTTLVPLSPPPSEDWLWGLLWLQKTYLVCKDPRTLTRLKIYAAYHEVEDVVEILTLAIRFGLQFGLYVKIGDVLEFRNRNVSYLDSLTLGAIYAPGYVDECLSYGLGEIAAYTKYLSILGILLVRPNAVAFVYAGGVLSFVAQMYDKDLVARLMRGSSMQVSEYNKGDTVKIIGDDGEPFFAVSDSVSPSEVSMLLGHVATGNPQTETWLWPPPALIERESLHAQGMWTPGLYNILENLKAQILDGHYEWRTRKAWVSYFRGGNKGTFAPSILPPTKAVFEEGNALLRRAFPVEWNHLPTLSIAVPEVFDPLAHRD
jgi:hypothetical protein